MGKKKTWKLMHYNFIHKIKRRTAQKIFTD